MIFSEVVCLAVDGVVGCCDQAVPCLVILAVAQSGALHVDASVMDLSAFCSCQFLYRLQNLIQICKRFYNV
jgi:hypothetical protein